MKKVFALVVLVLVASLLVMPVFAASAHMSVSVSKGTVTHGDTFSITVSTGTVENCFSGGFMLNYNTNVFEYVSGSALVSGFAMSGISTANGQIAGYFMNTAGGSTVSGSLFQITLKVKDNAAYGSYFITGIPSMTVMDGEDKVAASCGVSGTTVTVVCNHKYGSVTKLDDSQHGKICSECGNEEKEDHKWGGDKEIEQATCQEGGKIQQTCSVCSATRIIDTDPTTDHKYGSVTKLDDNNHGKTCSVCGDTQKEAHKWTEKVTKEPTCAEEGVTTHTCSVCKATKTTSIPVDPAAHKYGSVTKLDDNNHGKTCSVCGDTQREAHQWTDKVTKEPTCTAEGVMTHTCSVCKATKTTPIPVDPAAHKYGAVTKLDASQHGKTCANCGDVQKEAHAYKTTWSKDQNEHWHECSGCKDKIDVEAHTPGAPATETRAQTCTTCGYVITPALGHKHSYATEWTTDEKGHWYVCSGCEEKGSYADHDFENACDPDCSVCGYTREIEHVFEEAWASDETNHWHECTECGLKQDEEAHIPGAEATETEAQACIVCEYELAPALGVEETTAPTEIPDATTPADQVDSVKASFPWWIIAVIAVAVVGVIVVMPKKKKQ